MEPQLVVHPQIDDATERKDECRDRFEARQRGRHRWRREAAEADGEPDGRRPVATVDTDGHTLGTDFEREMAAHADAVALASQLDVHVVGAPGRVVERDLARTMTDGHTPEPGSGPPEDGVQHRQELVRAPRTELEAAALSPEDAESGLEHVDGGDHEATAQELPRLDREGRGADDGALLVGGRRDFDLLDPQLEMPRGAVPGERRPTHTDRRSDRRAERRLDAWHEDPERNGRLHQTPGEQPDRSHGEPSERERPPPPEHEVEPYATGGVVSASGRPGRCA